MRVAVYGTLRQGFHNHYILGPSTFLGTGKTVDKTTMYSNGGFPIMSLTKPTVEAVVEVYEVDDVVTQARLDRLEGYPEWYNRSIIPVQLDSGEVVDAWIYHQEDMTYPLPIVQSGDWASK